MTGKGRPVVTKAAPNITHPHHSLADGSTPAPHSVWRAGFQAGCWRMQETVYRLQAENDQLRVLLAEVGT